MLSQFVEEMDLSNLYKTYFKVKENQASSQKLLKLMLYRVGEIFGDSIFIDGIKIEASSNKYTFVWKNTNI